LSARFKVFHFQELDWLLYFPIEGNCGKYSSYSVLFTDRKEPNQNTKAILGALLERPELDEHYPHTVGFFKSSGYADIDSRLRYMEIRIIHNVDEFWFFLNALNL